MKKFWNIIVISSLGLFVFSCTSEGKQNESHGDCADKNLSSFEVYVEPLLNKISKKDYNAAREELEYLQNLSIEEDSVVFAEIYSYFDSKLRMLQQNLIDDSEIQLMSSGIYLYEDSISKVNIDFLLSPAEPYTITVTDISFEVEPDTTNKPSFLAY